MRKIACFLVCLMVLFSAVTAFAEENAAEVPVVYFTTDISAEGIQALYEAMGVEVSGENVGVKITTGEPPASNYLRVDLIGPFTTMVGGTFIENNTAYGGSRAATQMHKQVAEDHGFTAVAPVDILDEEGSAIIPVEGGTVLKENYVGSHLLNYDFLVVMSHFKGHMMAGYGGALKQLSIGCASVEGKCLIHTGGKSHTSPWGGDQTAFTESMAEASKSVVDLFGAENCLFFNVMNRLSIDCDCSGFPAEPDIHDIGILASTDPVALDQACMDLIYQAEGNEAFVQRVERQMGVHTIEHAEAIGLGSRTYTLVNIDE